MSYDLDQYNEAYNDAETAGRFAPVPDGTYQVYVDEVKLTKTQETGMDMLAWKFKIISDKNKGRLLFKNTVIMEKTLPYIKTDLSICGLTLEQFSDLPDKLQSLLNTNLEIKVVSKTSTSGRVNQNIYIQCMLDMSGDITEDDIPF